MEISWIMLGEVRDRMGGDVMMNIEIMGLSLAQGCWGQMFLVLREQCSPSPWSWALAAAFNCCCAGFVLVFMSSSPSFCSLFHFAFCTSCVARQKSQASAISNSKSINVITEVS